jgi:hypothetical protein
MQPWPPTPAPQALPAPVAQCNADQVADRPKRNCAHHGQPHRHGTRVAYVKDRCRCPACTAANTAASRVATATIICNTRHATKTATTSNELADRMFLQRRSDPDHGIGI